MPDRTRELTCIATAQECFSDLAALFEAIDERIQGDLVTKRLAGVGKYLAEDWREMMESLRGDEHSSDQERQKVEVTAS